MAETAIPPNREPGAATDDYLVERADERVGSPIGPRVIWILRALLVIIMAAVSLALLWVVGTMIGLF